MTERSVDLLVAGGGVFGLWVARRAAEAGLSAVVVEPRRVGWGASGGLLGALTAHTPDRWSLKKQFQFDALAALEAEAATLEAETGMPTGYRRAGRVMPVRSAAFDAQIGARSAGAAERWRAADRRWRYEVRRDGAQAGWLEPDAAARGYVWDDFAARLAPRAYLAALRAGLVRAGVEVREGVGFAAWAQGRARLTDGGAIACGAVALATGFEMFALLAGLVGRDLGGGAQGQSALFRAPGFEARPLLYEDGVYVIPHDDGRIAVGSTDRKSWNAPDAVDPSDRAFLERAAALCPPLRGLEPVAWWAGVRPKAWTRDPIVGRLPGPAPLWVAGGGFKIGFGVAHRIASALVDRLTARADPTPTPERFTVEAHLEAADRRAGASA